ncbi:hypothetical protein [Cellulomonas wangsupingiae]|uniref:Uncharacterized protein n=1 Tax=Cellulomonas wangsupingiae TaxID=2968085 RepID=A0ABY5K7U8_9CELL|nr:hypothetical protein [Cellulomonas wangsupingiae]MCC2333754.1 hypothetical protein [Cellulomonas wangsupingiae]MCM0639427.1 hypothetical protein [Cellulomonas wangsupingiae]UUI65016.1 hypothetical protein NP075_18195 [Cellulomonas wangsupingiae]
MTMLLLPAPHEACDGSSAAPSAPSALAGATTWVPCAAHPGAQLRHLDGPCRCFFGGPPPEFPPSGGTPA